MDWVDRTCEAATTLDEVVRSFSEQREGETLIILSGRVQADTVTVEALETTEIDRSESKSPSPPPRLTPRSSET